MSWKLTPHVSLRSPSPEWARKEQDSCTEGWADNSGRRCQKRQETAYLVLDEAGASLLSSWKGNTLGLLSTLHWGSVWTSGHMWNVFLKVGFQNVTTWLNSWLQNIINQDRTERKRKPTRMNTYLKYTGKSTYTQWSCFLNWFFQSSAVVLDSSFYTYLHVWVLKRAAFLITSVLWFSVPFELKAKYQSFFEKLLLRDVRATKITLCYNSDICCWKTVHSGHKHNNQR